MDEGRAPGVATSAAHLGLRHADVRCEAPSTPQNPHGDPEEGRVDGPPVPRSHAGRVSSSGRPLLPPRPQREGIRVMRLRTRLAALALSLLGLSGLAALAADPPAPKGKPLAVLFLGDNGQHRPPDRFAQIAPVLAGRGIDVTYTEKISDLNPETLGKYDALIIYANIDRDRAGPGEGAARLRRRRRRLRPAPLRLVLLPQLARVRRPGRRPVPEARHRRVRDEGRRPGPPDHEGPRAVPHLGRDLRPHQAQRRRTATSSQTAPTSDGDGALDLGPHAGQGPRLLHRLGPRRSGPGATPASTTCSSAASAGPRTRARSSTRRPARGRRA